MSAIADEVALVLLELEAAGVTATADPGTLLGLVSAEGSAVLVLPPEVTGRRLDGSLALEVPLQVCVSPPGGFTEYAAAWEVLEAVLVAVKAQETERQTLTLGDQALPCYQVMAARLAPTT